MDNSSKLKRVVITGASQRLGLFLSQQFLQSNFHVIALTRIGSDELRALANRAALDIVEVGAYDTDSITTAINRILNTYDRIDLLIHNASAFSKNDAFSTEAFTLFFDVHMQLPAQLNEGLKPLLDNADNPGVIVHITDIYCDNPNKDYVLYCATKAGLENLTKGFAKKFAPGVRSVSIQPGPIQFLSSHDSETKASVLAETLLLAEGGFEPIYQAIVSVFENPYITGSSIKVDGGRALGRG